MDKNEIIKLIRKEIQDAAIGAMFSVANIPFHQHDGITSPKIDPALSLLGFPVYQVPDATVVPTDTPQTGTIRFYVDNTPEVALWIYTVYVASTGVLTPQWLYLNPTSSGGGGVPGGVDGDLQINDNGIFGTIGGLNLNKTGNTRGTYALDVQSYRGAVTEVASGDYSVTIGTYNKASSNAGIAIGIGNSVTGSIFDAGSIAVGDRNTVSGSGSVACGSGNTASNSAAAALGVNNTGSGVRSAAVGISTTASGTDSSCFGIESSATNTKAVAIGYRVHATANYATAIGSNHTNSSANTVRIAVVDSSVLEYDIYGNLGIGGSDYQDGVGVIFIRDAGTAPTTTPSAGGILYSSAGALYWLGTAGTTTMIAPA